MIDKLTDTVTVLKMSLFVSFTLLLLGLMFGAAVWSCNKVQAKLEQKIGFGRSLYLGTLTYLTLFPLVGGPFFLLWRMVAAKLGIKI